MSTRATYPTPTLFSAWPSSVEALPSSSLVCGSSLAGMALEQQVSISSDPDYCISTRPYMWVAGDIGCASPLSGALLPVLYDHFYRSVARSRFRSITVMAPINSVRSIGSFRPPRFDVRSSYWSLLQPQPSPPMARSGCHMLQFWSLDRVLQTHTQINTSSPKPSASTWSHGLSWLSCFCKSRCSETHL